jgi:hypothetical protein
MILQELAVKLTHGDLRTRLQLAMLRTSRLTIPEPPDLSLKSDVRPSGRRDMPLLTRRVPVSQQPRVDHVAVRAEGRRRRPSGGLRSGGGADPSACLTVRGCTPCRRADACTDNSSDSRSLRILSNSSTLEPIPSATSGPRSPEPGPSGHDRTGGGAKSSRRTGAKSSRRSHQQIRDPGVPPREPHPIHIWRIRARRRANLVPHLVPNSANLTPSESV